MRFRILGTLHVHSGSREVPITTVRERILLAMLLLNDGDRVSVPLLAEAIWADQLPRDAPNQVQKCVSRLRKHLAEAGIPRGILITDHGAYRLSVDSRQIDLHEFRGQWAEARTTADRCNRRPTRCERTVSGCTVHLARSSAYRHRQPPCP